MKKFWLWTRRNVSTPALVMYALAVLSLIIHLLGIVWADFSDLFSRYVAGYFRMALSKMTGLYRFSLAEIIILCIPVFAVWIITTVVVYCKRGQQEKLNRFFSLCFALVSLFYTTFVFTYGMGYRGNTLDHHLKLDKKEVSVEELTEVTSYLAQMTTEAAKEVTFHYGADSVMPYSFEVLNEKMNEAYADFARENDFLLNFESRVKPMLLSKGMSYIHMLGMYTYYTGESNINMEFPDYTIPFTVAHEMAHQRGIAREDEANFMAFLVCITSKDAYIRYSGYMNMYEYAANALYKVDKSSYYKAYAYLSKEVRYEMQSYTLFFNGYRESAAAKVSNKLNNAFLQSNGQKAGTQSYGMAVDLAVAYYKPILASLTEK